MFDSLQQSISGTAASTATIGGAVTAVFIAAAGSIFYDLVPLSLPLLLRGSQQGSVELQSSDQGGLGDAAAWRLLPGGSGGPPARFLRVWRRRAALRLRYQLTDWRWNKCACIDAFFLVCVRVRGVRVRGWKEPTALFPTV